MPIKLSDKRRSAIYKAVSNTICDMRIDLRLHIRTMSYNEVDIAIAQLVPTVYDAVLAAAEGRERP